MKTVQIKGEVRENIGKKDAAKVRANGGVPCVLYGGETPIHFSAPVTSFNKLLFTPDAYLIDLSVEGKSYTAILQDKQYDPVSDVLIHADLLLAAEGKPVEIAIPVKTVGIPKGVTAGGKLQVLLRKLKVRGAADKLPDYIEVPVTPLELGGTVQVKTIAPIEGVEILTAAGAVVARVQITRSARMAANETAAAK